MTREDIQKKVDEHTKMLASFVKFLNHKDDDVKRNAERRTSYHNREKARWERHLS